MRRGETEGKKTVTLDCRTRSGSGNEEKMARCQLKKGDYLSAAQVGGQAREAHVNNWKR